MSADNRPEASSADAASSTPFSDEELDFFRELLLSKRQDAMDDKEWMMEQVKDAREQSGNDSAYSYHMADAGTDAQEREKLYRLIAHKQRFINSLDRALDRIDSRTYGICSVTGQPIAKQRLIMVPHTTKSVEGKRKQYR